MQKWGILEMLRCMKFEDWLIFVTWNSSMKNRIKKENCHSMLTHSLYFPLLTLFSCTHSIFPFSLYAYPLTIYSPSHSMLTHSLHIFPLTLCSPTHSIFPLSLYVPPLTPYFPSHSMLAHSLYIPPLTLCSSIHSIFHLSLYAHPLTLCSPTHSMLTHLLYIPLKHRTNNRNKTQNK